MKKATIDETPATAAEDCQAQVSNLQHELDAAQAQIFALEQELEQAQKTGRAGFMVTTPNAQYNGTTAGVQFRAGRAFIPAGEQGERTARMLAAEFDYNVQAVEDWQATPEAAAVGKSLIDTLMIPHRR